MRGGRSARQLMRDAACGCCCWTLPPAANPGALSTVICETACCNAAKVLRTVALVTDVELDVPAPDLSAADAEDSNVGVRDARGVTDPGCSKGVETGVPVMATAFDVFVADACFSSIDSSVGVLPGEISMSSHL